jgi:hypothetical protein
MAGNLPMKQCLRQVTLSSRTAERLQPIGFHAGVQEGYHNGCGFDANNWSNTLACRTCTQVVPVKNAIVKVFKENVGFFGKRLSLPPLLYHLHSRHLLSC